MATTPIKRITRTLKTRFKFKFKPTITITISSLKTQTAKALASNISSISSTSSTSKTSTKICAMMGIILGLWTFMETQFILEDKNENMNLLFGPIIQACAFSNGSGTADHILGSTSTDVNTNVSTDVNTEHEHDHDHHLYPHEPLLGGTYVCFMTQFLHELTQHSLGIFTWGIIASLNILTALLMNVEADRSYTYFYDTTMTTNNCTNNSNNNSNTNNSHGGTNSNTDDHDHDEESDHGNTITHNINNKNNNSHYNNLICYPTLLSLLSQISSISIIFPLLWLPGYCLSQSSHPNSYTQTYSHHNHNHNHNHNRTTPKKETNHNANSNTTTPNNTIHTNTTYTYTSCTATNKSRLYTIFIISLMTYPLLTILLFGILDSNSYAWTLTAGLLGGPILAFSSSSFLIYYMEQFLLFLVNSVRSVNVSSVNLSNANLSNVLGIFSMRNVIRMRNVSMSSMRNVITITSWKSWEWKSWKSKFKSKSPSKIKSKSSFSSLHTTITTNTTTNTSTNAISSSNTSTPTTVPTTMTKHDHHQNYHKAEISRTLSYIYKITAILSFIAYILNLYLLFKNFAREYEIEHAIENEIEHGTSSATDTDIDTDTDTATHMNIISIYNELWGNNNSIHNSSNNNINPTVMIITIDMIVLFISLLLYIVIQPNGYILFSKALVYGFIIGPASSCAIVLSEIEYQRSIRFQDDAEKDL